jgi:hypothetical protein
MRNRPISAYWTLSFVPQHCINERVHLVIEGTFNIIYDFVTVLIPIPIVMRLNLPLRQRIIVALLFGMGFVVCFAGVVRTYYMYRVTDGYHDVTWDAYPVWFGTAIELYLGIVCSKFLMISSTYLRKCRSVRQHHQPSPFSLVTSRNSFPLPPEVKRLHSLLRAKTTRSTLFTASPREIERQVRGLSSTSFLERMVI